MLYLKLRTYFSPGNLPDPDTEHKPPALQADSLPSESPEKPFQSLKTSFPFQSLNTSFLWPQYKT